MARTTAERIAFLSDVRDQMENRLAEMLAHPRPSYDVDGQSFDFKEYQQYLLDGIANLDNQIAAIDSTGRANGGLTKTQVFTGT